MPTLDSVERFNSRCDRSSKKDAGEEPEEDSLVDEVSLEDIAEPSGHTYTPGT
ncbi:hypothetical protein GCM10009780_37550 [Actinomadura alba]